MRSILKKVPIDTYTLLLIATVLIAAVLPVSGAAAKVVSHLSTGAVALLFFLYGARLKAEAIVAGIANWKLQLLVIATTFALFPLLGLGLTLFAHSWLPKELVVGLLFLCLLPSTVQSSIALTAMANGNVPAAICAASVSNMLGVVLTPVFAALLLSTSDLKLDGNSVIRVCLQLLLPFFAGQVLRPLIGEWIERNRLLTMIVDRGSILLIIYSAFSAGVVAGIWGRLDGTTLSVLIGLVVVLLFVVIVTTRRVSRLIGFSSGDEISFVFCGSQKSLASGVPMANILFAGQATGLIILPLMLYHQFQLFVCAAIAQRRAERNYVKP